MDEAKEPLQACSDPDCPACQMLDIFKEFKAQDVPLDVVMSLVMVSMGEAYDMEINMTGLTEGTIH